MVGRTYGFFRGLMGWLHANPWCGMVLDWSFPLDLFHLAAGTHGSAHVGGAIAILGIALLGRGLGGFLDELKRREFGELIDGLR